MRDGNADRRTSNTWPEVPPARRITASCGAHRTGPSKRGWAFRDGASRGLMELTIGPKIRRMRRRWPRKTGGRRASPPRPSSASDQVRPRADGCGFREAHDPSRRAIEEPKAAGGMQRGFPAGRGTDFPALPIQAKEPAGTEGTRRPRRRVRDSPTPSHPAAILTGLRDYPRPGRPRHGPRSHSASIPEEREPDQTDSGRSA
jgi:hypothetical protein